LKLPNSKTTGAGKNPEVLPVVCVCAFLALAVLAVFGQTAHFGFVNYDDDVYVYENARLAGGLNWPGVAWVLTHAQCSLYHPLTMLSLMLDYQFHGLQAGGYHLTNVLIHAASSVLLFLIMREMTGALWRSAFLAAVFAIHPLRVESVAWVTERKDVLGAFFFMLTLGAYIRYVRKPESLGRYLMVAVFFGLDLLCKPTAVTLPFVLLLLDYWPLGRMRGMQNEECRMQNEESRGGKTAGVAFWRLVKEKIPLAALAALACAATIIAAGAAGTSKAHISVGIKMANALVSYAVYLRQIFWPAGLAVFYPFPKNIPPLWELAAAFLLLAVITGGVAAFGRKRPWLLVGWLWYLGMLVPVIGVVQVGAAAHADRNTYLPHIGLYLLLTWAAADLSVRWRCRRLVQGGCAAAVLAALFWCAQLQASYWRSSELLWKHTLSCTSGNYLAHFNLGNDLVKNDRPDEAIAQFREAVKFQPAGCDCHYNLANALLRRGNLDDAIDQFRKSLEITPDHAEALNNLGNALAGTGADQDAIAQYQRALQIQPDYADARLNLGRVLLRAGQLDEAGAQFRKLLESKPGDAEFRHDLGEALLLKGDFDGAMSCFEATTAKGADPAARWRVAGDDFLQREDWAAAIACYRRATVLNPRTTDAWADLGMACYKKGAGKEAIEAWQQALAIDPSQFNIQNNLAWLLATAPDTSLRDGAKAVALATQASQAGGGGNPVILHTLAVAYAEAGNYAQAAATARQALALAAEQKKEALADTLQQEIKLYEANPPPRHAP
jgi:tetratricopeptide (TPR) repeat protein